MNPEIQTEVKKRFAELYEKIYLAYSNAENKLTKDQFVEVLTQAVASGDFERLIVRGTVGDSQTVSYIPFRERDGLLTKLKYYEDRFNKIRELIPDGIRGW